MDQESLGWVVASESEPGGRKRQEGYRNTVSGSGVATGSIAGETANLNHRDGLSQSGPASEHRSTGGAATSPGDTMGVDQEALRWREENQKLSAEYSELQSAYQALSREEQALRVETFSIKEELAVLERSYLALVDQAGAYERSVGWTLIKKARNVRRRIFREGRFSGRCWHLFSRFTATMIDSGPRLAIGKAVRKIRRKIAGIGSAPEIRDIERTRVEDPLPAAARGVHGIALAVPGRQVPGTQAQAWLFQGAPGLTQCQPDRSSALLARGRREVDSVT